jgi:hypothetical protein
LSTDLYNAHGNRVPPLENSSIDEAMNGDKTSQKQMEANLDVVVQMTSYDPLETLAQHGAHIEGASTLRPTQYFREANLRPRLQNSSWALANTCTIHNF